MFLTPLRESHSARGNPRVYAPKGPPEAISPGGPLQAHRGGMRLTSHGLTPSGMRALHGWDHPPRASHAVNTLKDQTVGCVPSLAPWIITIPGRRPVPPRPHRQYNRAGAPSRPRGETGSLRGGTKGLTGILRRGQSWIH
jgi:hypothetical protein